MLGVGCWFLWQSYSWPASFNSTLQQFSWDAFSLIWWYSCQMKEMCNIFCGSCNTWHLTWAVCWACCQSLVESTRFWYSAWFLTKDHGLYVQWGPGCFHVLLLLQWRVRPLYCTREVVNLVFFWSLLCLNTIFVLTCPLTFFNYCFKLAIVKLCLVNYCISDYAKLVLSWFFCFALRRLRYSVLNCQEVYWLKARCKVMQATSLGFLWEGTSSGWRVTHK